MRMLQSREAKLSAGMTFCCRYNILWTYNDESSRVEENHVVSAYTGSLAINFGLLGVL